MAEIHPTAIVDPTAEIAEDVKIGPYCVVEGHVRLGKGCVLHNHVVLGGPSVFGERNEFFPFAVIGLKSQDLKYKGEPTYLEVGDDNVFRENCNITAPRLRKPRPSSAPTISSSSIRTADMNAGWATTASSPASRESRVTATSETGPS